WRCTLLSDVKIAIPAVIAIGLASQPYRASAVVDTSPDVARNTNLDIRYQPNRKGLSTLVAHDGLGALSGLHGAGATRPVSVATIAVRGHILGDGECVGSSLHDIHTNRGVGGELTLVKAGQITRRRRSR